MTTTAELKTACDRLLNGDEGTNLAAYRDITAICKTLLSLLEPISETCQKCNGQKSICGQSGEPWRDCGCGWCERGPNTSKACPDCGGSGQVEPQWLREIREQSEKAPHAEDCWIGKKARFAPFGAAHSPQYEEALPCNCWKSTFPLDSLISRLAVSERRAKELETENLILRVRVTRDYLKSPAMQTFAEMKYSRAGAILTMLQDGVISRGKACEVLAELAHGIPFEEVQLPKEKGNRFGEDDIPAEVCEKLKVRIAELEAALERERGDFIAGMRAAKIIAGWFEGGSAKQVLDEIDVQVYLAETNGILDGMPARAARKEGLTE